MKKLLLEQWNNFVNEAKEDDLASKYPEHSEAIHTLASTGFKKYLPWAIKHLQTGENVQVISDLLSDFEKYKSRLPTKDINQYKTLQDLEMNLAKASKESVAADSKRELSKQRAQAVGSYESASEDSEIIYEDDEFYVVRPMSTQASCYFGQGTKWCTSATDPNTYNPFERYYDANIYIYYIMDLRNNSYKNTKENKYGKVAVLYLKQRGTIEIPNRNGIWDSTNTEMTRGALNNVLGDKSRSIHSAIIMDIRDKADTDKEGMIHAMDMIEYAANMEAFAAYYNNGSYSPMMFDQTIDYINDEVKNSLEKFFIDNPDKSGEIIDHIQNYPELSEYFPNIYRGNSDYMSEWRNYSHSE